MSDEKEIESPCTSICIMAEGICTGCGMTEKESNTWYKMDNVTKQAIVDRLETAKSAAKK